MYVTLMASSKALVFQLPGRSYNWTYDIDFCEKRRVGAGSFEFLQSTSSGLRSTCRGEHRYTRI